MILVLLFSALMIRLAYVQLGEGPELSAKAEESWRRNIPYSAKRGRSWIEMEPLWPIM